MTRLEALEALEAPRTPRSLRLAVTLVWILCGAITVALASDADARKITPPAVPATLTVDAGSRPYFAGHAVGTQNYVCTPVGAEFKWVLFTPQATLYDPAGNQLTTHFFSPNPEEDGTIRPTWQHSRDTSRVWARGVATSTDSAYVAPDSLSWVLLDVVGTEIGPNGGNAMTFATQIHRVNTQGGIAPPTGCSTAGDVGKGTFVPYEADYIFYTNVP